MGVEVVGVMVAGILVGTKLVVLELLVVELLVVEVLVTIGGCDEVGISPTVIAVDCPPATGEPTVIEEATPEPKVTVDMVVVETAEAGVV